ncbi:MAG: hypothetical protein GY953_43900 [bacterium]|nr:hypothetical protein [bacterium]
MIQLLTYLINDGPRGVHRITCRADWQAAPAAEVASMLRQNSQRLRDALVPSTETSEIIWLTSRYFLEDSNMSSRQQPLDYSREVFDGTSSYRIYSMNP